MKKIMRVALFIFTITFLSIGMKVSDATILGSHFGITLSVDAGTKQFNNSWVPTFSGTGSYIVDNWNTGGINPSPFGDMGEAFDVEAMYIDIVGSNIYFAIVTSVPQSGYPGSTFGWSSIPVFDPGDIRIGVGSGSVYEYGIKVKGINAGNIYQNSTWTYDKGSAGYAYGYPTAPLIYRNPSDSNKMSTKINTSTGTNTGTVASFAYYDTGLVENPDLNLSGGTHLWSTSVIEGIISKSDIGNPSAGIPLTMVWSPDCNNDWEHITTPVPEPMTILLLGFGITAIGVFRLKNKKKK